jgi:hypothetical protein
MEKARRDALRAVVNKTRRSVEESLERQLSAFGLSCKSTPIPREDLALHPAQEALYPRLLDAVRRQGRAVGADGQITPQAVTRFVRETGGTWINRLAALRALEARGLLAPAAAFVADEYGGGSPARPAFGRRPPPRARPSPGTRRCAPESRAPAASSRSTSGFSST